MCGWRLSERRPVIPSLTLPLEGVREEVLCYGRSEPVWQYIVKRILLMIPTLFGAALVVFLLMHVVPGDIAMLILGTGEQGGDVNLQDLARLRENLGLNRP